MFSTDIRAPRTADADHRGGCGPGGSRREAGRSVDPNRIPGHPLLLRLLAEGYDGFARAALAERAQASWPAFNRLAAGRRASAEAIATDLSNRDDTLKVVSGSRIVFLVIGLRYEIKVWLELWPRIYIFDSTKFTETFRFQPTSYAEGVRRTAQSYRQ